MSPRDFLAEYVPFSDSKPKYMYTIYSGGGRNLNRPSYTTVFNDKIYIADTNNARIAIFSYDGKYQAQFGSSGNGHLRYPVSICMAGNKFFVADTGTQKIHIFDLHGKFLGYFAQSVTKSPNSIFFKDDRFYVIDNLEMKAFILDGKGKKITSFGKKGLAPGQFYFPYSIFVSDDSKIYITDSNNNRIQIFDLRGKLIKVLTGADMEGEGNYSVPRGVALDKDGRLFTAEGLINAVSITDKNGQVILRFRNAETAKDSGNFTDVLKLPTSVYIDQNQRLYVTEFGKSRVLVYKL